jgi:hypothetical protein
VPSDSGRAPVSADAAPPLTSSAAALPEPGWDPNQLIVNIDSINNNIEYNNNNINEEEDEEAGDDDILVDLHEEEPASFGAINATGVASGGSLAQRHVLTEEGEKQQCGGTSVADNLSNLKNITLVNILILVLLVIVIAANVNEGDKFFIFVSVFLSSSLLPMLTKVTIVFFYICERFLVIVINEGVHFLYL